MLCLRISRPRGACGRRGPGRTFPGRHRRSHPRLLPGPDNRRFGRRAPARSRLRNTVYVDLTPCASLEIQADDCGLVFDAQDKALEDTEAVEAILILLQDLCGGLHPDDKVHGIAADR